MALVGSYIYRERINKRIINGVLGTSLRSHNSIVEVESRG